MADGDYWSQHDGWPPPPPPGDSWTSTLNSVKYRPWWEDKENREILLTAEEYLELPLPEYEVVTRWLTARARRKRTR